MEKELTNGRVTQPGAVVALDIGGIRISFHIAVSPFLTQLLVCKVVQAVILAPGSPWVLKVSIFVPLRTLHIFTTVLPTADLHIPKQISLASCRFKSLL